ncbi:MAG: 3'(2'),5'-bisphosphate nucleotidase CysQ [Pseudomonadota bacterium]|nr:3'(2'),5'-bisphosphate nucleotidase CysQ [Pseudomonadota bacterium]
MSLNQAPLNLLLTQVEAIARRAAAAVMAIYATDFKVEGKADDSPVTAADRQAEAIITRALQQLSPEWPQWPVVAEEAAAAGLAPQVDHSFWLVDPLDGTREFVARNGEFTVNIALVQHGTPVLGVVLVPASGLLYSGLTGEAFSSEHHGAWRTRDGVRQAIHSRAVPPQGAQLATSRSHGNDQRLADWLKDIPVGGRTFRGSSWKFGLLAEGSADLYPRFGRTMEWDTAAGHAVLAAAGGSVCNLDGSPLQYGKPCFENPHFVARGCAATG